MFMVLSLNTRLRRLQRIHSWATDFLVWLDQVFARFNPQEQPIFPRDNIKEQSWKTLSFFLHTCREGFAIRTFPRVFDAVQTTPIECCGMIEANAHVLTYRLAHEVYMRLCEVIQPGCTKYGDIVPDIPECIDELTNKVWEPISKAIRLEYAGCIPINWQSEIPQLNAILEQEYGRAANLLRKQSTIVKVHNNKIPPDKRTKPMSYRKAAFYMGKGKSQDAAEWLSNCVNDKTILCEHKSRQSHVFSVDDFPKSAWPQIRPGESQPKST
jgi:hypothetical protein